MTRAERMTRKHLNLARKIAYKQPRYATCLLDLDDLIQVGTIGLIEAADHWQPRLGPFRRYASVIIYGRIKDAIRIETGGRNVHQAGPMRSLDEPIGPRRGGRPRVLGDIVPAPGPSHVALVDGRLDLEHLLPELPTDERAVLVARYWKGQRLCDCLPGLSRPGGRASQLHTSALTHLSKLLA